MKTLLPRSLPILSDAERVAIVRQAFWLEWLTVGWMIIEAGVALWSGIAAHNLSLTAFGMDSLIELASAGVLIWRLSLELKQGKDFPDSVDVKAGRIAGGLLFLLALYVTISALADFWHHGGTTFSGLGLAVTLAAMPIMYFLARRKFKAAELLGSAALRADAIESVTCGYLSVVVVVGLIGQFFFHAWWIDPLTSLAIVWFLVKESREAWRGEACCC